MNSNRTIEELRKLFGTNNISTLGSDVIAKYFDEISVGEVERLCRVNRQFNEVCKKESMWKRKVENDYGIDKMYESTWRKTAQLLFNANMINLNEIWLEGKTYGDLFYEGLESESDNYFKDLFDEHKIQKVVFPPNTTDIEVAKRFIIDSFASSRSRGLTKSRRLRSRGRIATDPYEEFNTKYPGIMRDLENQVYLMTRELSVITLAVAEIRGIYSGPFTPSRGLGLSSLTAVYNQVTSHGYQPNLIRVSAKQREISKKIARLIDPMFYVMTYSTMLSKELTILMNNV